MASNIAPDALSKKKPFLVFGPMEKREVQIWSVWTRKKGFAAS